MAAEVASSTRFLAFFSSRQLSRAASHWQAKSSSAGLATLGFKNLTPLIRGQNLSALCDPDTLVATTLASSRLSPSPSLSPVLNGSYEPGRPVAADAQTAVPLFLTRVSSLHTAVRPTICHRARVRHRTAGPLSRRRRCSARVIAQSIPDSDKMTTTSATSRDASNPFSVLFVCMGNICRSPSAEAVFRSLVEKKGMDSLFSIDSAGTLDFHEGNPADSRMRSAAKRRGIDVTSIARGIKPSDFQQFDLILAMDRQNYDDILRAYHSWSKDKTLPANGEDKVKLMCSYCRKHTGVREVPDPYYGGRDGFERVLDLLEDACAGLLDEISSTASARQ